MNWTRYKTSEEFWNGLYADCARATKSIDMELYIFDADGIGDTFLRLFKDKAQAGVKIRLLFDMIGSRYFFTSPQVRELQDLGIEVKFFNPAYIFRFTRFIENFFRTHRKIVIIDKEVGHLGGINIAESMRHWRDTSIRFTGGLTEQVQYSFEHMWAVAHKNTFKPLLKNPNTIAGSAVRTNAPHRKQRFLYKELRDQLRTAKKSVYMTTPYFVPDFRFFRVILKLAKQGVDVRLLVPEYSDHILVDLASQSHFTLLLKAGVHIYRYTGTMMHTKSVVVDDAWATVGSMNLDNVSFLLNHEANIVTNDQSLVTLVKGDFIADLEKAIPINLRQWKQRSVLQKVLELCTWPLHQLL